VAVVRVQKVLGLRQVGQVLGEDLLGPLLDRILAEVVELGRLLPARVVVLQARLPAGRHTEQVDDVFADHGSPCYWMHRRRRGSWVSTRSTSGSTSRLDSTV